MMSSFFFLQINLATPQAFHKPLTTVKLPPGLQVACPLLGIINVLRERRAYIMSTIRTPLQICSEVARL